MFDLAYKGFLHTTILPCKAITRHDQFTGMLLLPGTMTTLPTHNKLRFREFLTQIKRRFELTHHIVSPVRKHGGDVTDGIDTLQNVIWCRQPSQIHKIMRLDLGKRRREFGIVSLEDVVHVGFRETGGHFPRGPEFRRFLVGAFIIGG